MVVYVILMADAPTKRSLKLLQVLALAEEQCRSVLECPYVNPESRYVNVISLAWSPENLTVTLMQDCRFVKTTITCEMLSRTVFFPTTKDSAPFPHPYWMSTDPAWVLTAQIAPCPSLIYLRS